nr:putative ribonuclease H-like domain-containing protein [Tanacetum cinerariifolium]
MRIEQYFLMTDYSLWEVILNDDSHIPTKVIDGVVQVVAPTTTEKRLVKKNELKVKGTLLMDLPDKHQLKFNIHKDAKSLMEAIEKRFGGNKETKKYKADLEEQSLDDLFNNLKIYEDEVKSSSSTSHNTQNIVFVSSQNTDSTNESVSVVTSVYAASTKPPASILPNVDNLSDAGIYSFFASQSNSLQLDNDDLKQIDADDLEEMDLKWQMVMLTMRAKSYDWRFQDDEEPTNYALVAFTSSSSSGSESENENVFEEDIKLLKLDVMLRYNALVELRKKFEKAEEERDELKLKLENFQTSSKNLSKLLESQITDKTGLGYDNQVFNSTVFDFDELNSSASDVSVPTSPMHDRYKSGKGYHAVPPPYTGTFMPLKPDLVFHDAPTASETVPKVFNGNPQQALKDKGVTDSGCSRHMTANISYLSDFEEINGGYVAFGRDPKGGKITGKDTKCVVLSFDFKLPDENHVLLRVLRENNMYNVDLKNIVPSGDLTCLFAKATLDESNLWHKRLGHVNFKTMNKLVKCNLVRGLPSKVFKNNHTCVACKKGKQHRVSCKSKHVSSINQPLQRVLVTKPHNKTPYELLLGRTPSIGFMRPFGCPVTILNTLDPLGDFDRKVDEGFLVGYYVISKAFRVFNSKTRIVQETLHINFLENQPNVPGNGPTWLFDIDTLTQSMNYQPVVIRNQPNHNAGIQENFDAGKVRKESVSTQQYVLLPLWSTSSKDPQNTDDDVVFDDKENESNVYVSPSSSDKPKKHDEQAKKEAKGKSHFNAVGPSNNAVSPNFGKSSFVDPSQYPDDPNMPALEDIVYSDDEEVVGPEADFSNLEKTYAFFMGFMVYQMDVKSAFLYETIKEEVYVYQPLGFEDPYYPDKVYKVVKALYGLHQAPRAWYETLANYLLENGFQRGKIDQTLFIKKKKGDIYLVQVYVDDIIFGSTNKELCKAFEKLMKDKFQMSSIGELTFFLGLQVNQKDNGIFISQDKYVAEILRKFGFTDGKSASTPIDTKKPLLKDLEDEDVDVHIYRLIITAISSKLMLCGLTKDDVHLMLLGHNKSDASEGFDQIVDFLNAHTIQYALMVNPTIYVSCIKQFWASVSIKKSNDVVKFQALINMKKVIITEDTIRQTLRLDDADGVETLLFDVMLVPQQVQDDVAKVQEDEDDNEVSDVPTSPSPTPTTTPPPPQQESIASPPQA